MKKRKKMLKLIKEKKLMKTYNINILFHVSGDFFTSIRFILT